MAPIGRSGVELEAAPPPSFRQKTVLRGRGWRRSGPPMEPWAGMMAGPSEEERSERQDCGRGEPVAGPATLAGLPRDAPLCCNSATPSCGGAPASVALVTWQFLESLCGTLKDDIAALKQELAAYVKDIRRNMGELQQRVDSLEQTQDSRDEEPEEHRRKLLSLRDKAVHLNYLFEELENRSRRCNIRIKGVPLQADAGKLADYIRRIFQHVAPDLADQVIVLDHTHRAGQPAWTPGQLQDILTYLHYFQQTEAIIAALNRAGGSPTQPARDGSTPPVTKRKRHKPSAQERHLERAALLQQLQRKGSASDPDTDKVALAGLTEPTLKHGGTCISCFISG
ncbi:hypothetical protein NDU88_005462 [Pleurodeles waltl]|uniref:Uncharacterized protein n=1 Tax=Pleurodeles waltl TaxID=8319 RepID=A0AAV7PFF9_PLEWA|nr:hypothetical protein NDU88_005462 [Pleurodeles waltl]